MSENVLPSFIIEELKKKANHAGVSVIEYIIDLLSRDADPNDRVLTYIRSAEKLLQEAREEIERGDLRQASEKIWGACALAVKAYALAKDGLELRSHGDLWVYKDKIADELGDWVRMVFMFAFSVYVNFYEDLVRRRDVEDTLGEVERFVREVSRRISEVC